MAEIQVSANQTVQMSSFVDGAATQRFTVKRRLYTEADFIVLGIYQGGTPAGSQTFNAINVPTVFEIICDSNWAKYGTEWKRSAERVKYFNNPNDTVVRVECADAWGGDGDFNDLVVQLILK
ncbi:MAG: hypothetical protein EOO92_26980 [Pedobacter sp.]|nr:MAG: hypothetical protein EOO92_26980 [Pedobacter sp.]